MQQLPALGVRFGRFPSAIFCILLLASLAAPATIHLLGRSTDTTFIDNRPAKVFPALPISLAEFHQFPDNVTKFVDDRFGLRAELVKLNIRLNHRLGVSKVPNLFVGKDGWIFLKEDSAGFGVYRGLNRFSADELDRWINIMELFQRWLALHGSQFVVVMAPNQQTIYPDYMPGYITRVMPETRLDQIVRRLRERNSPLVLVDPRAELWDARRSALLYHRYENHWNPLGAFLTYQATMRAAAKLDPDIRGLKLEDFDIRMVQQRWPIPPFSEWAPNLGLKTGSNIVGVDPIATINGMKITKVRTRLDQAPSVLLFGDFLVTLDCSTTSKRVRRGQCTCIPLTYRFQPISFGSTNRGWSSTRSWSDPLPTIFQNTQRSKANC